MSDIVERLRSPEVLITNGLLISPVAHEGAARIEALDALSVTEMIDAVSNVRTAIATARGLKNFISPPK
jgi:hypothetical protein